ncbi:hypothetical protein [Mesorhizobium sp. A623]
MIAAIVAQDIEQTDKLASDHAERIVRQIQAYITADTRTNAHINI